VSSAGAGVLKAPESLEALGSLDGEALDLRGNRMEAMVERVLACRRRYMESKYRKTVGLTLEHGAQPNPA
jgi:hypothetical protein